MDWMEGVNYEKGNIPVDMIFTYMGAVVYQTTEITDTLSLMTIPKICLEFVKYLAST